MLEPVSTEIVYQISDEQQKKILQDHFNLLYILLAENKLVPSASFESEDGIKRGLSGSPVPFHNAVFGCPSENPEACIKKQVEYFDEAKTPFVWFLDEGQNLDFKDKLLQQGFVDTGVFQGVIAILDKQMKEPKLPQGCTFEFVTESTMDEFNDLVCEAFGAGEIRDIYKKIMQKAAESKTHPMQHLILRKNGKAVSAASILIEGDVVSFWNCATSSEMRRQGLNTALCQMALKEAISRGCRISVSYLMTDELAFGIFTKLGHKTKWRFNAFLADGAGS